MKAQGFVVLIKVRTVGDLDHDGHPLSPEDIAHSMVDSILSYSEHCVCKTLRPASGYEELEWSGEGYLWSISFDQSGEEQWDELCVSDALESGASVWDYDTEAQVEWNVWPSLKLFEADHVLDIMAAI